MSKHNVCAVLDMSPPMWPQLEPAKDVVEKMINQIVSQEKGFQYFRAEAGKWLAKHTTPLVRKSAGFF